MSNTKELLKQRFDELLAEKAQIEAQILPIRERYNEKAGQIDQLRDEMKALGDQIHDIERPRMIEISEELSNLSLALGHKRLSRGTVE